MVVDETRDVVRLFGADSSKVGPFARYRHMFHLCICLSRLNRGGKVDVHAQLRGELLVLSISRPRFQSRQAQLLRDRPERLSQGDVYGLYLVSVGEMDGSDDQGSALTSVAIAEGPFSMTRSPSGAPPRQRPRSPPVGR